jgi:hypothetical protein
MIQVFEGDGVDRGAQVRWRRIYRYIKVLRNARRFTLAIDMVRYQSHPPGDHIGTLTRKWINWAGMFDVRRCTFPERGVALELEMARWDSTAEFVEEAQAILKQVRDWAMTYKPHDNYMAQELNKTADKAVPYCIALSQIKDWA